MIQEKSLLNNTMHGRLPPMENFFAADVRCVDRKTG
jgi:hypothetical protein